MNCPLCRVRRNSGARRLLGDLSSGPMAGGAGVGHRDVPPQHAAATRQASAARDNMRTHIAQKLRTDNSVCNVREVQVHERSRNRASSSRGCTVPSRTTAGSTTARRCTTFTATPAASAATAPGLATTGRVLAGARPSSLQSVEICSRHRRRGSRRRLLGGAVGDSSGRTRRIRSSLSPVGKHGARSQVLPPGRGGERRESNTENIG